MNGNAGYVGYQLRELLRDGTIGSVFTDPVNPDDFIAGYVRAVGARTALVQAVTPYGVADGWFGIRLSAILEVQYDSVYAERLELLMKLAGSRLPALDDLPNEDAIVRLTLTACEHNRAVTIWTASETYAGFPVEVNDLFMSLAPVDFMGERCPPISFRLADVEMVSLGSEEERMYETLDDYHHQHPAQ